MNNYLKKIKIFFSVIILLLMISIAGGSFMIKDNDFLRVNLAEAKMVFSAFTYKINLASANDSLLANVFPLLNANEIIYIRNDYKNNHAKSIPVLTYHGIINKSDGANVLLENFRDQMFALKKAGWETTTIEDFYQFVKGEKELLDKSFLLTFDDGRKDSYYPVDPILKALDYSAVMFVISKRSLGDEKEISPFHLSENELRRMTKSGRWDIQPHTRDGHDFYAIDDLGNKGHFYSNKLWLEDENRVETEEEFTERISADFEGAKQDIENFGGKSISFAFPFGDYGQESINFPEAESIVSNVIKSIYPVSFYQVWTGKGFSFNYPDTDKDYFMSKRISVKAQWSDDDLLAILENSREKDLPYYDDLTKNYGWQKNWGSMNFSNDSMFVGAHASTTGGAVFLDGAYLWQDYIFKADINPIRGQVFALTARYKDGDNYTACLFSNNSIRIEEFVNGEKNIIDEWKDDFVFVGKEREAGIGVYDNVVNCYLDGEIALKGYNLNQELDNGGIGFKTWDPLMDNSKLVVKNVSVEEIK